MLGGGTSRQEASDADEPTQPQHDWLLSMNVKDLLISFLRCSICFENIWGCKTHESCNYFHKAWNSGTTLEWMGVGNMGIFFFSGRISIKIKSSLIIDPQQWVCDFWLCPWWMLRLVLLWLDWDLLHFITFSLKRNLTGIRGNHVSVCAACHYVLSYHTILKTLHCCFWSDPLYVEYRWHYSR